MNRTVLPFLFKSFPVLPGLPQTDTEKIRLSEASRRQPRCHKKDIYHNTKGVLPLFGILYYFFMKNTLLSEFTGVQKKFNV